MMTIDVEPKHVEAFGSNGVTATRLATLAEGAVTLLAYAPGGHLGRHPAAGWQLFAVTSGSGWVTGDDGERHALTAGDAVTWRPREEHESGSGDGMTVTVVETQAPLKPEPVAR